MGTVDIYGMFGPRTPLAASLQRTSNRNQRCVHYVDPYDLRHAVADEGELLQLLEEQISQREQMVKFLERQLREWSGHPSASTWSEPQREND